MRQGRWIHTMLPCAAALVMGGCVWGVDGVPDGSPFFLPPDAYVDLEEDSNCDERSYDPYPEYRSEFVVDPDDETQLLLSVRVQTDVEQANLDTISVSAGSVMSSRRVSSGNTHFELLIAVPEEVTAVSLEGEIDCSTLWGFHVVLSWEAPASVDSPVETSAGATCYDGALARMHFAAGAAPDTIECGQTDAECCSCMSSAGCAFLQDACEGETYVTALTDCDPVDTCSSECEWGFVRTW